MGFVVEQRQTDRDHGAGEQRESALFQQRREPPGGDQPATGDYGGKSSAVRGDLPGLRRSAEDAGTALAERKDVGDRPTDLWGGARIEQPADCHTWLCATVARGTTGRPVVGICDEAVQAGAEDASRGAKFAVV